MLSSTVLSVVGKRLSHVMQSPLDSSYVLLFCVSADLFSCPFAFLFVTLCVPSERVKGHCWNCLRLCAVQTMRGESWKQCVGCLEAQFYNVLKLFNNCSILSSTICLWMELATFIFFEILQKGNFYSHQCLSQVSENLLREYNFLSWISHCWPLFRSLVSLAT